MIIKLKHGIRPFALIVLPGNRRVALPLVAKVLDARSASLASREEAEQVAQCPIGAIPALLLGQDVPLIVDPSLLLEPYIYVSAGSLNCTLRINTSSYVHLAQPLVAIVSAPPNSPPRHC